MASSGNFATLHPSNAAYADLKDGNVRVTGTSASGNGYFQSTFGISSGKWYAEMYAITMAFSHPSLGLTGGTQTRKLLSNEGMEPNLVWYAGNSSSKLAELSMDSDVWGTYSENESSVSTISATNVIMIALDADNKKIWYGNNGTWYNSGDPAANDGNWAQSWTTNPNSIHLSFGGYVNSDQVVNFGQDSTFGGRISAGGNADGNGFGDFKYTPPTGFLALCSANLPISDDIDPAQTDDDFIGGKQFGVVTYTGNGGVLSVTGLGFKPDLVWGKMRSPHSYNNMLYDSSRGANKVLQADTNNAEIDLTSSNVGLRTFDSDGFTLGSEASLNDSGDSIVAWCWRANGGVTSSNTNGDITTTVQANQKAGFSIFTYTGNGGGAGTSMGHGLSQAPDIWFLKQRSNNGESSQKNWRVMLNTGAGGAFRSLSGSSQTLVLNETSAAGGLYRNEGNFEPTSTVVQAPNNGNANSFFVVSGNTYVSYCWHSVEGYSKFGSYVGNGDADGPFIYTGFRPKMFFIKNIGATSNWHVYDTERSTFNVMNDTLNWNDTSAEQTDYAYQGFDVLSNGIKTRGSNGLANSSGVTYIYGAWGDVPFKYNNTF